MVRVNNDRTRINITGKLIADIANMARDNELQRVATRQSREKRTFNVEDRDIHEIARIVERNSKDVRISKNAFTVNHVQTHRRLGYNEYIYNIRIGAGNVSTLPEFYDALREVFGYLINVMNYIASSPTDKARFYISNAPRTTFSTAVLNVSDFNVDMFFDIFEKHMQSNAQEVIDGGWSTTVSLYIFPNNYVPRLRPQNAQKKPKKKIYKALGKNGADIGRGRKNCIALKHGREIRNGVFQINSKSEHYFALALLTGRSFLNKDKRYDKLNLNRNTLLNNVYTDAEITNVYEQCGLDKGGVRIDQMSSVYAGFLSGQNIDLVIFSKNNNDNIVYDSRTDNTDIIHRANAKVIFLWLNDGHYDLILSPNTFSKLKAGSFCFNCMNHLKRWESIRTHVCRTYFSCHNCYSNSEKCTADENDFFIQCPYCFVNFKSKDCYTRHLTKKVFLCNSELKPHLSTPCQQMFFCKTCYKKVPRKTVIVKKTVRHDCDMMFCNHCMGIKKKTHECFMKICKVHKEPCLPTLYFFDFETRKDCDGYMIPFYAVIQKVCHLCDEKPFVRNSEFFLPHPADPLCDISVECVPCCGYRQYVLEKQNGCITKEFIDFMYAQARNSVWIAHNGGRFDSVFLLRELLVERNVVPKCIMSGNKIMCMELEDRNLKVIDSFLFLSMALKKFPEALGIPNICKGFHPYLFYDLNYTGSMVGLEYFDPPQEGSEERLKFDVWYAAQREKPYVFREAIYYYCRLDVDILRQGCIVFARLIKNITNVFPFYDKTCHTIAGLALKVYRTNFLNESTIGQIPPQGYGGNINQSTIALLWLRDIEKELSFLGNTLCSKLSPSGEYNIMGNYVDGYCSETNTIYQFHGCFFHGCQNCYDGELMNYVLNETFYTLRERTRRITKKFESNEYTVIEMWECDFMKENKLTRSMLRVLREKDFFINNNLNPRDALYGGRVSPACLYAVAGDKKIRYNDFTSLYPYVQKIYEYPTKHPEITRGLENCAKIDLNYIFGLVKCKILPPTNLLFPIIPYRTTKLTFPLCRTCADTLCGTCTHSEGERVLTGTWTSIEIQEALKHGYVIKEVYEIYNYTHREKIFDKYVNTFMKLKQESSGIPKNCYDAATGNVNNKKLEEYAAEYLEHEGVELDVSKISYNPGQRTVMKALLNSLWGKLAQNEDTSVVKFLDRFDELLELVNDNSIEVTSLDFISDDVARTTHRKIASLVSLPNRNVVIASFVTAYARLELFRVLHKLGDGVLYYDTDSVFYVEDAKKGHVLTTGSYLGQLTDELYDKNSSEKWIETFCATGPKAYSYRTNEYIYTHKDGTQEKKCDEIIHVKGFSLKGDTRKKITFDSICQCVHDKKKEISTTYTEFMRDNNQTINVQKVEKVFRFTFDKRVIREDFKTVPYGYIDL